MAKYVNLNSGNVMPMVALGTWKSKPGQVEAAVVAAIEAGYRHIDCAYGYGNESEVGAALKQVMDAGIVKREELFICSKLWNTRHKPVDVKPSLQESLTALGLSYLDLYLIHWPIAFKSGGENFPRDADGNILYEDVYYMDTWKALEECVDEGLIKSIGVSNFNSEQIQDVIDKSRIKPAVLQIEVNPYFQQDKLLEFAQQKGLAVVAYSCLGSPDRPWAGPNEPSQMDEEIIQMVAKQHGKSSAQVILRWLIQRGLCVIAKSVTKSRIIENIQLFDFELSPDEMTKMRSVNKNHRTVVPTVERNGKVEFRDGKAPYFPFHIEF